MIRCGSFLLTWRGPFVDFVPHQQFARSLADSYRNRRALRRGAGAGEVQTIIAAVACAVWHRRTPPDGTFTRGYRGGAGPPWIRVRTDGGCVHPLHTRVWLDLQPGGRSTARLAGVYLQVRLGWCQRSCPRHQRRCGRRGIARVLQHTRRGVLPEAFRREVHELRRLLQRVAGGHICHRGDQPGVPDGELPRQRHHV